jgi:hypothetical protein
LVVGGSRSGKTTLLVHEIAHRAVVWENSRHAILRLRANAARASIALDTLPKVFRLGFPAWRLKPHRTEGYFSLQNGSEIWIGGLDDQERVERILGMEYATIFLNEWAGAAHETMLLAKLGGSETSFTDANVLSDYSAVTGFNADDLGTDQGTDMQQAARYRRLTGVIDATGHRHLIASYLRLEPGHMQNLLLAAYMFVAGVGLQLPSSALDQAANGRVWDVAPGSANEGGHYVPLFGRQADGLLVFVSWGRIQLATERFVQTYCDEAVAYLSQEDLVQQKSPDGFDFVTLAADLAKLA